SYDQRRIAVAEEAVPVPDRLPVRGEDPVGPRESAHQHEERRSRQVEIREETVHGAEPVAGSDEEVGGAGAFAQAAALRRRFQGPERGRADRDDAPTPLAGAGPAFRRLP